MPDKIPSEEIKAWPHEYEGRNISPEAWANLYLQDYIDAAKPLETKSQMNIKARSLGPITKPMDWADGECPFESESEFTEALWLEVQNRIRLARKKFNMSGPLSITVNGHSVKFIGMETYRLAEVQIESPASYFYFKATDAGIFPELNGLERDAVSLLFGNAVANFVTNVFDDVQKEFKWTEAKKMLEFKLSSQRYANCEVKFGSW